MYASSQAHPHGARRYTVGVDAGGRRLSMGRTKASVVEVGEQLFEFGDYGKAVDDGQA